MEYLLLIIGFVLLIKGADFFVEGSSSLARFLKIPSVIIGLTIVAMGTSAPEASVSINAALAGNNDIAVSNIIGSNIFNGLIVVGICAFMAGFKTNRDILKRDMPVNILITAILCVMIADGRLSRLEGILLLAGMIFYIVNMILSALKTRSSCPDEKSMPLYKSLIFIAGGLVSVIFGGNLVVNNASQIAVSFGVSQNFIGLTIVAIGTSLPELVTSIVATRKGDSGLALGNAVKCDSLDELLERLLEEVSFSAGDIASAQNEEPIRIDAEYVRIERSTSMVKSTWPGVSMMLKRCSG